MESLENNDCLILYFEKSIKFLGEGKNVRISIDGTLWHYMQPTWCKLLVVECTVRMENAHYLDIPVSLICMSNKLKKSFRKIIMKLNYLLQKLTEMRLGTRLFCTESEQGLTPAIDDFITNKTKTSRLNCTFHLNQNVRSYYAEELICETQYKHPSCNKIYIVSI